MWLPARIAALQPWWSHPHLGRMEEEAPRFFPVPVFFPMPIFVPAPVVIEAVFFPGNQWPGTSS